MDQKLSDSFEGEDKINAMIFCKMSTKKMVCNLYLMNKNEFANLTL